MYEARPNARIARLITGLSVLAALPVSQVQAAATAAGARIENTATATFSEGSGQRNVSSNTVSITVDELLDVAAASLDGGSVQGTSSTAATLAFSVSNTGNGPEAFSLEVNPAVGGNDFNPVVDTIALDSNGNAMFDPGIDQQLIAPTQTAVIAANSSATAFVRVSLPSGVADGASSRIELVARALTGNGAPGTSFAGQGNGNSDAVVGVSGATATAQGTVVASLAAVSLTKSATVSDPFGGAQAVPGARINYSIVAQVSGTGSVDDLVVSDPFPTGTTYQPASLAIDGQPLSDAADTDAGAADASGISVNLGTVSGGTTHSITFAVQID